MSIWPNSGGFSISKKNIKNGLLRRRSKTAKDFAIGIAVLALFFIASVPFSCAQDQEEAQRRRWLFDKLVEIAQKAESRNDYLMSVGMYEAALDRTNGQEQYVSTLANIARCYTKLGYYWRVEPILEKLSKTVEQKPALLTEDMLGTIKGYIELLKRVNEEQQVAKYVQLLERLSTIQTQTQSIGVDQHAATQESVK